MAAPKDEQEEYLKVIFMLVVLLQNNADARQKRYRYFYQVSAMRSLYSRHYTRRYGVDQTQRDINHKDRMVML